MYSYASTSTCHRLILKVHRIKTALKTVFWGNIPILLSFSNNCLIFSTRWCCHLLLEASITLHYNVLTLPSSRCTEVTTIDYSLHILNNNPDDARPDDARPISLSIFTQSKAYVFGFVLKLNWFFLNVSKQTNKSINPRPYPAPCDEVKKRRRKIRFNRRK